MVSDPTPQKYDSSMDRSLHANNQMGARPFPSTSPQIVPVLIDLRPFRGPGSEIFSRPIDRRPFRHPGNQIFPSSRNHSPRAQLSGNLQGSSSRNPELEEEGPPISESVEPSNSDSVEPSVSQM